MTRMMVAGAVVAFVLGTGTQAIWGQHEGHGGGMPSMAAPSVPQARTGKIKGQIVDTQEHSITVLAKKNGKVTRSIYLLDSQTKTKGSPAIGAEVVVKYREQLGVITATDVEVPKAKSTRG